MNALQPECNVEKIATVSTATIGTTLNTSDPTKTTITQKEKLSRKSSLVNTKAAHAGSQAVQKNTVNATKPDSSVEKSANVSTAKIMSR